MSRSVTQMFFFVPGINNRSTVRQYLLSVDVVLDVSLDFFCLGSALSILLYCTVLYCTVVQQYYTGEDSCRLRFMDSAEPW